MQPISPAPIQVPISLLEKTPAILDILLRDLPQELLQWKPAADRWSIAEVLDHMVIIEHLFEQRVHRVILEEEPTISKFEALPEAERQKKSLRHYLEEFVPLRRAFVYYLHSIPASAAARTGQHTELGTITLSQMLHELAHHDLGHLRQIAELYRAHTFYPHAGPFQKYSNPKP
ncbi:MAG: DinB family protein [Candidatus Acidiferrum sp.]